MRLDVRSSSDGATVEAHPLAFTTPAPRAWSGCSTVEIAADALGPTSVTPEEDRGR